MGKESHRVYHVSGRVRVTKDDSGTKRIFVGDSEFFKLGANEQVAPAIKRLEEKLGEKFTKKSYDSRKVKPSSNKTSYLNDTVYFEFNTDQVIHFETQNKGSVLDVIIQDETIFESVFPDKIFRAMH